MQNKIVVVISLVALIALFFVGKNLYMSNESAKVVSASQNNTEVLQREYSLEIGNKDAKVQLVEFFDPACQTCAQFHPYVKDIMKKNEGNIRLVLRYAPFHTGSVDVVKMLEATRKQDKFMETLELLFATQKYWIDNHVVNLNKLWAILIRSELLNMDKLIEDMKDPRLDKIVAQDLADAKTLKATKTPSYYVNGKPLQVFGLDQLVDLINSELNK